MTPIERAARALFTYEPGPYGDCVEWAIEQPFGWLSYVDEVRLVLDAIRDPFQSFDDPVAIAGGEVLGVGQGRPLHWANCDEAKRVWQAMIDAALAEGKPA